MTKESDKQLKEIQDNTVKAISELLKIRQLKKGSVFVIGCSSSEVAGGTIGRVSMAVMLKFGLTQWKSTNRVRLGTKQH